MNTKKAKQAITLAIDTLAGRSRFRIRDVAEEALPLIKYEQLSIADQHEALYGFIKHEAHRQCTALITGDVREEFLETLPPELWPIFENLRRTITVAPGGYRVLSIPASPKDIDDAIFMMDALRDTVETGRQSLVAHRDLLRKRRVNSLRELIEGQAAA